MLLIRTVHREIQWLMETSLTDDRLTLPGIATIGDPLLVA